jgi:cyclophilin family peptidyl-prolyl cis-trans isomerase
MVRHSEPNTASSQFYICLEPQPERDGKFTVFAQVVDGMDALGSLAETPTSGTASKPYYRPLEPMVMETITIIETAPDQDEDS